jgi:probable rRNA maturation factor
LRYAINWDIDDDFQAVIDPSSITPALEHTLQLVRISEASLTIAISDDATVQALNRAYRGVDAPTDVLSFAHQAAGHADEPTLVLPAELAADYAHYLGDIIIAYPYAERQAAHYQNNVTAELRLLAVHGLLHLLGYDHASAEEEAAMWALQEAALAPFGDAILTHRHYLP